MSTRARLCAVPRKQKFCCLCSPVSYILRLICFASPGNAACRQLLPDLLRHLPLEDLPAHRVARAHRRRTGGLLRACVWVWTRLSARARRGRAIQDKEPCACWSWRRVRVSVCALNLSSFLAHALCPLELNLLDQLVAVGVLRQSTNQPTNQPTNHPTNPPTHRAYLNAVGVRVRVRMRVCVRARVRWGGQVNDGIRTGKRHGSFLEWVCGGWVGWWWGGDLRS